MSLNQLKLFSNVKITRDYSTVHDMTPQQWFEYLMNGNDQQSGDPSPPVLLYGTTVNYYRLPDVIRLEANYDNIRNATYGFLQCTGTQTTPSFTYLFFWVDSVRLVKMEASVVAGTNTSRDVVELTVTPDVWSNRFTECELYDSYIERRHVDRWNKVTGKEIYYPNAFDEVGGAYEPNNATDLTPSVGDANHKWNMVYFVVSRMTTAGQISYGIGGVAIDPLNHSYSDVYLRTSSSQIDRLAGIPEIIAGGAIKIMSANIQDIVGVFATPAMPRLADCFTAEQIGGVWYPVIDVSLGDFYSYFSIYRNNNDYPGVVMVSNGAYWYTMVSSMYTPEETTTVDPEIGSIIVNPQPGDSYSDDHEPLLHHSPALKRKIITTMGGEVCEVPDILAGLTAYSVSNVFDFNNAYVMVYGAIGIMTSNSYGCIGVLTSPSLPIGESAWKNYQAIQKTGDDIVYNAKQTQAAINIVTGSLGGAAMGAISTGNPAGAIAGGIGGVVSGAVGMWSNSEVLRAKRETIQNSPALVNKGNGGLGAFIMNYIDLYFVTFRLDDVSFDKLRKQYYYFGYNVRAVAAGKIETATRKIFDYIETRGARIRGNLNAEDAAEIARIFDRGVRIYHGMDGYKEIGTGMSHENYERSLIE